MSPINFCQNMLHLYFELLFPKLFPKFKNNFYKTIVLLLKLFRYCFPGAHFKGCVLRRHRLELQLTVCLKTKPSVNLVIYRNYFDQYSPSDSQFVCRCSYFLYGYLTYCMCSNCVSYLAQRSNIYVRF